MIEIDGNEGGGGMLRTALGFAVATGRPVRIDDVRGDRPTSGLKAQHVACIEAACGVSGGIAGGGDTVAAAMRANDAAASDDGVGDSPESDDSVGDGAANVAIGDDVVVFESQAPGGEKGAAHTGETVTVDVGTAGSATLVCSAALPAALVADRPFRLSVTGGTDVAWAPPADYFGGVTLELLRAHGLAAAIDVPRRGFYPDGGGRIRLTAGPSDLDALTLHRARTPDRLRIAAVASDDLRDADVADRLAREAGRQLQDAVTDVPIAARSATYVDSKSTGAVVVARAEVAESNGSAMPVAGASALGEPGVPSEQVARDAVDSLRAWLAGDGAVDQRLADQLVVPLALAGGTIRIPVVTDHVESAVSAAQAFGFEVRIDNSPAESVVLSADGQ